MASPVFNKASALERASHYRYAAAPNAKHLRKEFLGEFQFIGASQVAHAQQPAAHAGFDRVARVAPSRLLSLSGRVSQPLTPMHVSVIERA